MRRTTRAHVARGAARRKLVWATLDQNVVIPTGTTSDINLLAALAVAGSSLLGVTIMRTHLRISQVATPNATTLYRQGLIVGRLTDVGIGVAGQVDPSNPELDWMYLDRRVADSSGAAANVTQNWFYDVRSKRKMDELNMAYILSQSHTSAGSVTLQLWARTLVALP